MVELSVFAFSFITLEHLLKDKNDKWKKLGGCPLVRRTPGVPLEITFGQDESIYKAYAQTFSTWKVDGIQPKCNKNEGPGRMVSGMQSYAFGYGLDISQEDLHKINEL